MKIVQIVPRTKTRLYGALVKKEAAISRKKQGTFFRAGPKVRNSAKWKHKAYKGWIRMERGLSEVVTAEVHTMSADQEWQMLSAFLGFVDRHFGDQVIAITIHPR
jgi:hypothetical protein